MEENIDGIYFTNIQQRATVGVAGVWTHVDNVDENRKYLYDGGKAIMSLDIDWNGARVGSEVINTTGDLLRYISSKSDLTIGDTSYTAAAGDHTHELTLQKNAYATSSIDLLDNTIYTLTAGGKSLAFKTPFGGTTYTAGTNITIDSGTISHVTPENASEGKKGNISTTNTALLATITTDAQGHVTGYETITPEKLWRLLQQYADALYQPKPIEVTGISLDKKLLTISANGIGAVTATISPSNATNQNITWTSSNPAIATVVSKTTSGKTTTVIWKSSGQTTITATAEGDESKQATCTILCAAPPSTTTYYSYVGTDLSGKLVDPSSGHLKSDIATQITTMEGVKTYDSVPSSLTAGTTINANQNYVYVIAPTSTLNNASIYLTNTSGGTIGTETLGTFTINSIEYTVKCTPSEVGTVLTAWKN